MKNIIKINSITNENNFEKLAQEYQNIKKFPLLKRNLLNTHENEQKKY